MRGAYAPRMERRVVNPWTWQDRFGFAQATEVVAGERVLYCAGQTSVDGEGSPLHAGDMAAQVTQAMDNLETVLSEAGYGLTDIARVTVYVTDVDTFREQGGAAALFGRLKQGGANFASTLLGIERLAMPELLVEIEATAVR